MGFSGEGVFETLKVVDSRPHALTQHLERLRQSAGRLGLETPYLSQIQHDVDDHLKARPLAWGRMRITWAATDDAPILSIDSAPTEPPKSSVTLSLGDWRVDESAPLIGMKTTNYVDYLAALRVAQSAGFDEALLANVSGNICEAATANVFYVLAGVIHTPPLSAGCLPGIARSLVLELCDVSEVDAPPSAMADASEVFLTSSLREVQAVSSIDETRYSPEGPVTAAVMTAWRQSAQTTWDPTS